MTLQDPNIQPDDILEFVRSVIANEMVGWFTAMPGVVIHHNQETGQAVVEGAIYQATFNPETGTIEHRPRPYIQEVPVLQPTGGGYRIRWRLERGDPVLLIYSCRPLGNWKDEMAPGPARIGDLMGEADAIAIPGFLPPAAERPSAGVTISHEENLSYLTLTEDGILIVLNDKETSAPKGDHNRFIRISEDGITLAIESKDGDDLALVSLTADSNDMGTVTISGSNQSVTYS